jgi:hypothetical protein
MRYAVVLSILLTPSARSLRAWDGDGSPRVPAGLTVENEQGKTTTLSLAELGRLPRHKVAVKGHCGPATYEGVSLADVLLAGKVTLGKGLKGPLLAKGLPACGPYP